MSVVRNCNSDVNLDIQFKVDDSILHLRVFLFLYSSSGSKATSSYVSAFGVYQDYYTRSFLETESPSNIRYLARILCTYCAARQSLTFLLAGLVAFNFLCNMPQVSSLAAPSTLVTGKQNVSSRWFFIFPLHQSFDDRFGINPASFFHVYALLSASAQFL